MAKPSLLAQRVCEGKAAKRLSQRMLQRVFRDGVGLELTASYSPSITPFKFDTPSPDDDVHAKQKAAFDRKADPHGHKHKAGGV